MDKIKKQEIYSIAGLEKDYLNLIVAIYRNSQFYIIFNEKINHHYNEGKENFNKILHQGRLLSSLVQKAMKTLQIPINDVSYNLPVEKLKIVPYEYFYKFEKPTLFTPAELANVNKEFLKNYQKNKDYQNFLFKVNSYILLEQKEIFKKPPFERIISSIKITGLLYQAEWKQLYKYAEIFKIAQIKATNPILLPYVIHINILFSEQTKTTIIVAWEEEKIQIFVFEKKIFTQFFEIDHGLNFLWNKISNKLNVDQADIKKYIFSIFNLKEKKEKDVKLNFLKDLQGKEIRNVIQEIDKQVVNYLSKVMHEMNFILEEKLFLNEKEVTIYLFGKIIKMSGLAEYIKNEYPRWNIKIKKNNFVGLKNDNDLYLIGNAYYRHLQNKIVIKSNKQ